jgi:MFS family permease
MTRSRLLLLALAAESFMMTFDGAAVQMTLPILMRRFGARLWTAQWTMTAFLLISTAALLPAGRAGDAWGRDRVWRFGVGLFAVASLLGMVAPTLWWLIAARAAQGLGAALATANAAPLLVEAFPHASGRALAIGNVAIALGLVAGPAIGSLLADAISWRAIFAVAVPLGGAIWWFAPRVLPRPARVDRSLDLPGTVTSAIALAGLVLGGTWGYRQSWRAPGTRCALAIGAVALLLFAIRESRARDPLLHRSLFTRVAFSSAVGALLLGTVALFSLSVAMPYYLITIAGRGVAEAGLLVGAVALGLVVAAPIAGRAWDRTPSRRLAAGGLALVAAALVLLAGALREARGPALAAALGLPGVGHGTFEAPNTGTALAALPRSDLSIGMATLTAVRNLGMTLGVAFAATVIDRAELHGFPPSHGVRLALAAGAVWAALGALAALLRPHAT